MAGRLSSLSQELAFNPLAESSSTLASNRDGIKVLVGTLRDFLPQYYGVEWIKETARYAANLAQADTQYLSQAGREFMTDWSQILESHPASYLRMIWTVDLCISKGRLPEDRDFPSWLRGRPAVTKSVDPNTRERSPQRPLVTDSGRLGGNMSHLMGFAPSLAGFLPYQDSLAGGYSGALPRRERVNAQRTGIFEGLGASDDFFADDEYFGREQDRMEGSLYNLPEGSLQDLLAWDTSGL